MQKVAYVSIGYTSITISNTSMAAVSQPSRTIPNRENKDWSRGVCMTKHVVTSDRLGSVNAVSTS
jgi:hypothetical protein